MRAGIFIWIAGLTALAACSRETSPDELGPVAVEPGAPTQDQPARVAPSSGSIDAPIPDDVATVIDEMDADKTVSVRVGTKIAVSLVGVPTAGYAWGVEEAPDFLEAAGETGGPTSIDQLQEGYAGGHHWEVFFFNVASEGSGVLRLEQRRPWETEEPAVDAFSVTIAATAGD
ncbi:MAG: protease inhibitor I42 family protein [Amphiplicatus sp.]